MNYTIFLAPSSAGGTVGSVATVQVTTGPNWASSTPLVRSAPLDGTAGSSIGSARVAAAGESSFDLAFTLTRPGSLTFVVLYASMVARYLDTYVAFDNGGAVDPAAFVNSDLAAFAGGIVARGSCAVAQAGVATTCTIGPPAGGGGLPGTYTCTPTTSCQIQNTCFGALCDYSTSGIVPNSTYKVVAVAQSDDGSDPGVARVLGSFRTPPSQSAPQPSRAMSVSPVVGPDRFSVDAVGQDKPGFVYVIVTRPTGRVTNQVCVCYMFLPCLRRPPD
jgi:hypothetical protein